MFITKKHIPRRTFLRGAGATIALPFLEAMLPAQTPLRETAANPNTIRRFVGIWHPHGAAPGYWSPLQPGKDFEFSFITKPLEPFRDHIVLITGLDATAAAPTLEDFVVAAGQGDLETVKKFVPPGTVKPEVVNFVHSMVITPSIHVSSRIETFHSLRRML